MKIAENEYGFKVSAEDYPEVEFTDWFWKDLAEVRKQGKFHDSELRESIDKFMYDEGIYANDDIQSMWSHTESSEITDDEYWACYHCLAIWIERYKEAYMD